MHLCIILYMYIPIKMNVIMIIQTRELTSKTETVFIIAAVAVLAVLADPQRPHLDPSQTHQVCPQAQAGSWDLSVDHQITTA